MRIGFVTALADEARTLALPRHGETEHLVEIAGAGMNNAARAADRLLAAGAQGLVSWGTAGGLDPQHGAGSLIIYEAAVVAAGTRYECDEIWRATLARSLSALRPTLGTGFSAEHVVGSAVEKAALGHEFKCMALDMESAAVGERALAAGLPFVALRVIVDAVDFDIPRAAISALEHGGQPRALPVAKGLMRRPQEMPALLRLARSYRVSLARLRLAARSLHPDFGAH